MLEGEPVVEAKTADEIEAINSEALEKEPKPEPV